MSDGQTRALVAFKIDSEEFAIDIASVQEINRVVEVTRIPDAPPHVRGVINLRGKIIPVIDLRRMLGFRVRPTDTQSRVMVIELGGVVAGFLVDSVSEVVHMPESAIEPSPTVAGAAPPAYVDGVGKLDDRLLILLNLRKMLVMPEAQGGAVSD